MSVRDLVLTAVAAALLAAVVVYGILRLYI